MQYTVSTILFSTNKTIQNDNKILNDESFFEPCYLNSYKIEEKWLMYFLEKDFSGQLQQIFARRNNNL